MSQIRIEKSEKGICLIFDPDGESLSVDMDKETARGFFFALGSFLAEPHKDRSLDLFQSPQFLDILSPTFQIASDDEGHPMLALQVDPLPPFIFRFNDRQAGNIAQAFLEILNTPLDIRRAKLS